MEYCEHCGKMVLFSIPEAHRYVVDVKGIRITRQAVIYWFQKSIGKKINGKFFCTKNDLDSLLEGREEYNLKRETFLSNRGRDEKQEK